MQSADGTAALPSTAFALPVSLQFPTITSNTKERAISWLLGRAEHNPFRFALSRGEALQLFTARPESSSQAGLLVLPAVVGTSQAGRRWLWPVPRMPQWDAEVELFV